mgnify:CR=1 FL=1
MGWSRMVDERGNSTEPVEYWGDEPADVVGSALELLVTQVSDIYRREFNRPVTEFEFEYLLDFCKKGLEYDA